MEKMTYEISQIKNGFLLYKSELQKPIEIVFYETFDLALADLQTLLNTNFMIIGQTYLDTNTFPNLTISIKND